MKNNTKLIMETWRRFLNEGEDPTDGRVPLENEPEFEHDVAVNHDEHLGSSDAYDFSNLSDEESPDDDDYTHLPVGFESMHDEIDDLVRQGMPRDQIEAKYPDFPPSSLDVIYANFYDMQSAAADERSELGDVYDSSSTGMEMPLPDSYDDM